MERITRTDNAFDAIDKINANFEEVAGADSKVVAQGAISGAGNSYAFAYFTPSPGNLLRITFPNGDFSSPAASSYGKLSIGYRDSSNTIHPLFIVEGGSTPVEKGYDIFVSWAFADDFKDMFIAVRATAGVDVAYIVTRIEEGVVKEYNKTELADTIAKAKARIKNDSCIVFPLMTDIHYRSYNRADGPSLAPYLPFSTMANMAECGRQIRFDNLVCLGDVIDGLHSVALAESDAEDMMRVFSGVGYPLLNVLGNHDDNRYGDDRLTESQIFAEFLRNNDERTSIGGAMNGANWYRDIERNKIRFIGLCGINYNGQYNFTSETQSWFSNTLSSLPDGYKVILLTHIPPVAAQTWSGSGYTGGSAISDIIVANNDKILATFEGHTHLDNVYVSPFVAISTSSNKCYNMASLTDAPEGATFPTRESEKPNEDLWDLDIFDLDANLLSVIRFGAGNDRYIHYIPIDVAAGGTETLTPSVITASTWETRASESSLISIASGLVSVDVSATSGTRLIAIAKDTEGNMEIWCISVA